MFCNIFFLSKHVGLALVTIKMNKPEKEQTLKSAFTVYSLLPQIAGAVVGFSAVAYLAGWREASAYYDKLGAPWVLSTLSSAQIMQESMGLVSIVAITGFISVILLLEESHSADSLRSWSLNMLLGASLFILAGNMLKQWLGLPTAYVFSFIAAILWAISAGLIVGELIGTLTETKLQWGRRHLHLVLLVVGLGLFLAPSYRGQARAEIDSNPKLSKLPMVSLSASPSTGQWRLVSTFSGQALLSQLAEKREERKFRIVASTEISEIRSTGSLETKLTPDQTNAADAKKHEAD